MVKGVDTQTIELKGLQKYGADCNDPKFFLGYGDDSVVYKGMDPITQNPLAIHLYETEQQKKLRMYQRVTIRAAEHFNGKKQFGVIWEINPINVVERSDTPYGYKWITVSPFIDGPKLTTVRMQGSSHNELWIALDQMSMQMNNVLRTKGILLHGNNIKIIGNIAVVTDLCSNLNFLGKK